MGPKPRAHKLVDDAFVIIERNASRFSTGQCSGLTVYWGCIGSWKDGNYYSILVFIGDYIGGYNGVIVGFIGIMENTMQTGSIIGVIQGLSSFG